MDRKEAYRLPLTWNTMKESQTKVLVDTIYNDFESRICENCEHFIEDSVSCFIMPIDIQILPKHFGCNVGFERKENE